MSSLRVRRRVPLWVLLTAFVVVPLVEIYVVIKVGQAIGPWWTILLLLGDAMIGSWLVKREGRRAWRALRAAMQEGRLPASELSDGILILIGGTLMIAPGFVTDVLGALMVLPVTRPFFRKLLSVWVARRLIAAPAGVAGWNGPGAAQRPGHDDVVRGDVVD